MDSLHNMVLVNKTSLLFLAIIFLKIKLIKSVGVSHTMECVFA